MKILLLTDAPKHNLALMKISAYHKKAEDEVMLNMPLWKADYKYASWIFEDGIRFGAYEAGGPGVDPKIELPEHIEKLKPDYSLFNLDHSLGYTFRACFRKCPFCKVPLMRQDRTHHSIWEFHNPKFDTIELLDNNIFYDPFWEDTFREIQYEHLKVIDHGMDLRLLDDHRAWWIKQLRWATQPKFAWDRMRDEGKVIQGMKVLKKQGVKKATVYVLMGFDTDFEEDLHRCEIINSMGFDPWPMLYEPKLELRRFRNFITLRYYRQYKTIGEAWRNFNREKRRKWWKEGKAQEKTNCR